MNQRARSSLDSATLGALAVLAASALGDGSVLAGYAKAKNGLRDAIAKDPLDALTATVLGGAYAFWVAERDVNPKAKTYVDALLYVSTCLSVGYADVFAVTQTGKAIATAIMSVGPAMAAKALDAPAAPVSSANENADAAKEGLDVQRAILSKLDGILAELRAART